MTAHSLFCSFYSCTACDLAPSKSCITDPYSSWISSWSTKCFPPCIASPLLLPGASSLLQLQHPVQPVCLSIPTFISKAQTFLSPFHIHSSASLFLIPLLHNLGMPFCQLFQEPWVLCLEALLYPLHILLVILHGTNYALSVMHHWGSLTSMDANPNMYPILIPPASNTFYFCHHPQPHHSQPYHTQSIIYHPSFIINGNSQYWAYSIPIVPIFPIFNRLPSPICPPLNSVKWSSPQNDSCHRRHSPVQNISSTMHIFRNEVNSPSWW